MRLNWKVARWAVCLGLLAVCAGCSGINHTQSVSPASILLPGLLQADPPQPHPDLISPTPGTFPT